MDKPRRKYSTHQRAHAAKEVFSKREEITPLQWMSRRLWPQACSHGTWHVHMNIIVMISGIEAIHGPSRMGLLCLRSICHLQLLSMQPDSSRDQYSWVPNIILSPMETNQSITGKLIGKFYTEGNSNFWTDSWFQWICLICSNSLYQHYYLRVHKQLI